MKKYGYDQDLMSQHAEKPANSKNPNQNMKPQKLFEKMDTIGEQQQQTQQQQLLQQLFQQQQQQESIEYQEQAVLQQQEVELDQQIQLLEAELSTSF